VAVVDLYEPLGSNPNAPWRRRAGPPVPRRLHRAT
jgi:hypothetical protein